MVQAVVTAPEQRVSDESSAGRSVYQSRIRFADGTMYLLRVIVAEEHDQPVILPVYSTSKIRKYWSAE